MQTTRIINKFHNLDVQIDDVWRELKTDVYLDATSWHNAFDFDNNKVVEGIEPIRDFFERIYMALDSLKATYGKDDSVLVVSSGGVHQAVHAYVNGLPLAGNMRLSPMKNCEYREYEIV
jgi:broad specificity phosphatase PhoE